MKQPASLVVGILLIIIAIAQLLRFIFEVPVMVDGITVPVSLSAFATLFLGIMAFWLLKERNKK